jgi:hypothetical protein
MKKAFIILAYKDPSQIEKLVTTLYHEKFDFYVHIDLKYDVQPFEYLSQLPNVFLVKDRYKMIWASYRFIEVLTTIIKTLLDKKCYDFISPFSGQDYPLKTAKEIYDYYNKNIGYSFMSIESENSEWYSECKLRYEKYHFTYYSFKGLDFLSRLINKVLPKRKFPIYDKIYGGPRATWLTLSTEAASYFVNTIEKEKSIRSFCKYTWAPDEFLIPTILMNSNFKHKIIFDSGRHIDWSEGGYNPKIFKKNDFVSLANSGKLYARKFDIKIDNEIYDLIDNKLLKKN